MEPPLAVYRRHLSTGRDRTLVAIILTSQVVPSLLSPELLLLAVDEVTRRWRRYLDQWDETVPSADRPAEPPMRLVEFVDRYCVEVEYGTGAGGCTGRCTTSRARRGCDPDTCAAKAWLAHVMTLARRAEPGHPARTMLARGVGRELVPRDDPQHGYSTGSACAGALPGDPRKGTDMPIRVREDGVDVDVAEQAEQGVIGYSPDGGYLIRGRRKDKGQLVPIGPDDLVEVAMADAVDQRVFGVGAEDPVVVVQPRLFRDGTVRRYLARYSWFEFITVERGKPGAGDDQHE